MSDRDMVNHPSHYETGKFECIDVMLETQGYLATLGFCIGNVFKYSYRHGGKNGKEDIEKLGWYRNKYIELLDRESEFIKDRDDIANDLRKMLPSAYAHLIIGTGIPEPPSVPDGMCAVKDIPEMGKDFSKMMNPPVEGYTYDDSCDFKPFGKVIEVNPDKDGWYDNEHIYMLEGANPKTSEINVPADKCLETVISNGASLLWRREDNIHIGKLCSNGLRVIVINGIGYEVSKVRNIDIPESCEGGNE